jgi:molybdopterin converting factor small subunit
VTIRVHLLGYLAKYSPTQNEKFKVDLGKDSTVRALLEKIQFPPDFEKMILVNGRQSNPSTPLAEGDEVFIFTPATGG